MEKDFGKSENMNSPHNEDDCKWFKLNVKLRIAMVILLAVLGITVYIMGLGSSCDKCSYCREINDGDPRTKGSQICRNAYDIIKEDAKVYVDDLNYNVYFSDGLESLNSSFVENQSKTWIVDN